MAVNPERPAHPVWRGLDRDRLFLWSDFTGWRDTVPGFPQVYPVTNGFVIADTSRFDRVAVLANYDHGLQGLALAEIFDGRGSVMMSGFNIVNRAGLDPAADRLLVNLVRYMADGAQHHAAPLVTAPIRWGDYESEGGAVTGVNNGLLVHTVPVVPATLAAKYPISIDDEGMVLAGGAGGWNTKPAVQYVPRGRRAYGPFTYTTGGTAQLPPGHAAHGEGRLWLRTPADRTRMNTLLQHPAAISLEMEIEVDGRAQRVRVDPGHTVEAETPIRGGTTLGIRFRGDRRLVLLETRFR